LAIYHLTANIISRARGQSAVAAAAYRAGAALRDERYGVTRNYAGKRGVVHSEIMTPAGAPDWTRDRQVLWNKVEANELRKDSQLARVIEVGLPIELSAGERVALARDYIAKEFVAKGMIADFCIRGETSNPHAHILLTLRGVTPSGFGPKERRWNGKAALLEWRSAWAERANEHLSRAGHAVRIDHRTLEAQQIELAPGRRIGVGRARRGDEALPSHLTERIAEQQRIAKENGETILDDPTVALRALTHQRPIFDFQDLARFLRSRTESAAQFDAVFLAVTQSKDLVALAPDAGGEGRFTSRDMIEAERSLTRRMASMAARRGHGVTSDRQSAALSLFSLNDAGRHVFEYLVSEGDAKAIAVREDAKAAPLAAARHAWSAQGLAVVDAEDWQHARDVVSGATVLLQGGAQRMALKDLERLLAVADKARAKVVLIGDSEQLRAMRVESPFQELLRLAGSAAGSGNAN
jgi:hypothetical protein